MPRFCSTMGTLLLALSLTTSAFADKKKKKGGEDKAESSESSSSSSSSASESSSGGGEDIDSMMSDSMKGKDKREKSGDASAEEKKDLPPPSDENSWERPPAEEEKPKGPPPKVAEKRLGDGKHIGIGLLAGWGFKTDRSNGMGASDPYGLGLGIRGGYTLDFNLYVGVYFMYYLGSSTSGTNALTSGVASSSSNYIHFGAEVGYDFWTGPVIIRPSLQLGPAMLLFSSSGGAVTSASFTRMMFGPGVTLVYPVSSSFFIGADARFNVVTSSNGASAFLLAAHGGLRFE